MENDRLNISHEFYRSITALFFSNNNNNGWHFNNIWWMGFGLSANNKLSIEQESLCFKKYQISTSTLEVTEHIAKIMNRFEQQISD